MPVRNKPSHHLVLLSGCRLVAFASLDKCSQHLRKSGRLGLPFTGRSGHSRLGVKLSCMARVLCSHKEMAVFSQLACLPWRQVPIFNDVSLYISLLHWPFWRKMLITHICYKEKTQQFKPLKLVALLLAHCGAMSESSRHIRSAKWA